MLLCFCHIVGSLLAASLPWGVVGTSHLAMCTAGLDHYSSDHCLVRGDRSFLWVSRYRFGHCTVGYIRYCLGGSCCGLIVESRL